MEVPKERKSASKSTGRRSTTKKKASKKPASESSSEPAEPKAEPRVEPAKKTEGGGEVSSNGEAPAKEGGRSRSRRGRGGRPDWRKPGKRRGGRGRRPEGEGGEAGADGENKVAVEGEQQEQKKSGRERGERRGERQKQGRNRQRGGGGGEQRGQREAREPREPREPREKKAPTLGSGMLLSLHGGFGVLTAEENSFVPNKKGDIFVPQRLMQKHKLREGSIVEGHIGKGQKHKFQLNDVTLVDGKDPKEWAHTTAFKDLISIDPDFHYAVGEVTGDVTMRIVDIICPIGRGQRGLIVAPPRTGKTTIMRDFAKGIEEGFPEVNLMVLLVDERPEEATEWVRSIKGKVFVSTSDEMAKQHIAVAEAVWKRATRLVEMGEDVVLILDSITRLARAYNNIGSGSGRTMSGGLDARAMERPRQIFGSARNTETAGSLTIIGTALIETGSRMDTLIFEEFKGTGNMELVLSRKLADRRVFPAIDIQRSGTRKEEKLIGKRRLKWIHTLRRVLARMSFIEAMELLETKLSEVDTNDEFLKRFEVDPEA